ncbi:MAG: DUF3343 domain-containing protein [Anaerovoracaceae bacterium]
MQKVQKNEEYVLTFSSFYKVMYAKDKIGEKGIFASIGRIPTELIYSCGQGLHIKPEELRQVLSILLENNLETRGVFKIDYVNGEKTYKRIK